MALPFRLVFGGVHLVKSLIILGLVVLNVFMAISLVDSESTRLRDAHRS
jgi:hypothetical protein